MPPSDPPQTTRVSPARRLWSEVRQAPREARSITEIGREQDLTAVRRVLGCTRLLTRTGGCGTTRLALELARFWERRGHLPEGRRRPRRGAFRMHVIGVCSDHPLCGLAF